MRLSDWIAWRYLKSKKSYGAVSAIVTVSIAGVAIATAAVVCVLSVFNGFKSALQDKFDAMAPDMVITPSKGKVFADTDSLVQLVSHSKGVQVVVPVVQEKALAIYGGRELPVTIKGADTQLLKQTSGIEQAVLQGGRLPSDQYEEMPEFEFYEDYEEYLANTPKPEALPSIGTAVRLGNMFEGEEFVLFAPRREGRFNPANPATSFVADSVSISGIFETKQKEYDEDMVIVPIGLARHLFQYDDEATGLELKLKPDADPKTVKSELTARLGKDAVVKERAELQEINFRMVNIEKWVSFLLLAFILMIAGFNIISTMTMLVLEKQRQISIMKYIGMPESKVGGVFASESIMVSLSGGLLGIALGVFLCWLQQEYGLIKLAGDPSKLLMAAYPVKLVWADVAMAFVPCVVLGAVTALISASFAKSVNSLTIPE